MTGTPRHLLDEAVALRALTDDALAARRYAGQTHPGYANMIGPYGGITAAQAMAAVIAHPQRLGEPVAFTGNYAAAIADGPFEVEAEPVRTNRSTQHWQIRITQPGPNGAPAVVYTATAVTALRRQTWSTHDAPMPEGVPAPESLAGDARFSKLANSPVEWLSRYDIKHVAGPIPTQWDGRMEGDSRTLQWMRDQPPRPLDFVSLTALSDVFYPRVWRRRASHIPIGTVSITIYFHASASNLAAVGDGYLLGEARGLSFFNGFFDQSACVWSRDGHLLVTSHQIVYYKE